MDDRLDIILFGATGFTGSYCIGEIDRLTKITYGKSLTWGVAGRSEVKLKDSLKEYQKYARTNLNDIPIIIADINNPESLIRMTSSAKVVINCCGPYCFYGEAVVKACIETSTHQVDICGETQYMEMINLKYSKLAEEKDVYIVQSCGYDCIPSDLGVIHLQKKFNGTLNSVETYLEADSNPSSPGSLINYATWKSLVHGIATIDELNKIRRQSNLKPLPKMEPVLKQRPTVHLNQALGVWGLPFLGADRAIILRTQRYLHEQENKRPIQVQTYQAVPTLLGLIKFIAFGTVFKFLVKYNLGQQLLLKYPHIFSAGIISTEQPSREKIENSKSVLALCGEGWETSSSCHENPDKKITAKLTLYNPAYGLTATMVVLSAITILTEPDKLPKKGGVYTPGAAFGNTSLFEVLQENGLQIEMQSNL